jgi:hypothetical protein
MKFIHQHLRFLMSMVVIGAFLMITMATTINEFLISSTNTTVHIKNCESKPPVTGTLNIVVTAFDSLNNPLPGERGGFYITHQKVNPDGCTYEVVTNLTVVYTTGPDGTATYQGPEWQHDNSQDLWRVEIRSNDIDTKPSRQVLVKYYSDSNFHFTTRRLKVL